MSKTQSARAVQPSQIIQRELKARKMTIGEFVSATGLTAETCGKLVNGEIAIDSFTATRLARAFDTSVDLWVNLQKNYAVATGKDRDRVV